MGILRLFAVFLIACGLFVQSAAIASAQPVGPALAGTDCQDMAVQLAAHDHEQSDPGFCSDPRLDCLVAMGCIAPLALTGVGAIPPVPVVENELRHRQGARSFPTLAIGPEPPPPQPIS